MRKALCTTVLLVALTQELLQLFRYATALALNGQMEEATRQLQVLRALQGQKTFDRLMQALDEMAVEHPVLKQLRQP